MSRTFRNNRRWFTKVHGEYYSSYFKNRSMKTPFALKDWDELPSFDTKWNPESRAGYGSTKHIVKVGDGDNYHRGLGHELKQCLTQIDRSRAKHALTRAMQAEEFDYETMENIVPAFDPWDWD